MAPMPNPTPPDDPGFDALFGDDPGQRPRRPAPRPVVPPDDEGYDVAGDDPEAADPPGTPAPPVPAPEARTAPSRKDRAASAREPEPEPRVEQVWSRGAEWGASIALLGLVGAIVLGLVYATFSVENLALPLAILVVGGLAWVALTYPIVITLERPVRLTPEQAARDYFGALSHHLPHYKRMWLLLGDAGRTSGEYGSFDGFKRYWRRRLADLRGGKVPASTPLAFEVREFKADKSAGKAAVLGKFQVAVSARGRRGEGPLETIRVETWFVRGPDNMWYLTRGTLPRGDG